MVGLVDGLQLDLDDWVLGGHHLGHLHPQSTVEQ
jgi:hypothetical protein